VINHCSQHEWYYWIAFIDNLDALMMGARRQCCCHIYLCKWTNPGDTTEIFHHVTHNTIDFGLQENLPKMQ